MSPSRRDILKASAGVVTAALPASIVSADEDDILWDAPDPEWWTLEMEAEANRPPEPVPVEPGDFLTLTGQFPDGAGGSTTFAVTRLGDYDHVGITEIDSVDDRDVIFKSRVPLTDDLRAVIDEHVHAILVAVCHARGWTGMV